MTKAFAEQWVGYGLQEFRPVHGTYARFDLSLCPSITNASDDLAWLSPPPDDLHAAGMIIEHQTDEEFMSLLGRLQASSPAGVPQSFWRFLGSHILRQCPASPTDCHWELSLEWIALPSLPGDRFLRFMSDSQYCYSWYLRVAADSSVTIVACPGLGNEDFEFESPLLEDCPYREQPAVERHVLDSLVTVAHSFPDFIYRIWIEGLIWFRQFRKLPMNSVEGTYAQHLSNQLGRTRR